MAGDGTTSVVVLCGALLKKALELLERGVHPTLVSDAFNTAVNKAVEVNTRVRRAQCSKVLSSLWRQRAIGALTSHNMLEDC